ncbi:MAG: hypothetical protein IT378_22985 [Sandaracinaceae bacterium]|nr:hypothetical protein [Sandaracinaceae bacterium]
MRASTLGLALLLVACSGAMHGADAGPDASPPPDATAGADAGGTSDAGGASDAGGTSDAGSTSDAGPARDAGALDAGARDAGPPARDAGRADAGPIAPGVCDSTSPLCAVLCFRAVTCVTECGGPETECGCCPCAQGSFDPIECPRP